MRMFLVGAVLALGAASVFSQSRVADETALRAQVAAFEAAINKRDMAGVAALFAPDADLIVLNGPLVIGRWAIQTAFERGLGTLAATIRISITVTDIRFLGSDVAIVNARAQFNEGLPDDRGTRVYARQPGGDWLISAQRVMPAARQ